MSQEQNSDVPKIEPQAANLRQEPPTPVASEESLERTAGVRQGDPNDARYYGPSGLPDSGFGTGQTDYGGSNISVGAPMQNYQQGYGLVPGYGAMGTQGAQGVENGPHSPNRDARIRQDVLKRLAAQPELAGYDFDIEVVNAIATLRGRVPDANIKRLAHDTLEPMREVRDIVNQLEIGQN